MKLQENVIHIKGYRVNINKSKITKVLAENKSKITMINMLENLQGKIEMNHKMGYFKRCMEIFMKICNRNLRSEKYITKHTHTHTHTIPQ